MILPGKTVFHHAYLSAYDINSAPGNRKFTFCFPARFLALCPISITYRLSGCHGIGHAAATDVDIISTKYVAYFGNFWYDKHRLFSSAVPAPF